MLQLLFFIISYGSLLVLLMPATITGLISTGVMLIIGCGLIVYKRVHKAAFLKEKHYYIIPIATIVAAHSGLIFYNRWHTSSKMQAIATLIHMSIETMLLIGAFVLSVLSVYFICAGLQALNMKLSGTDGKRDFVRIIFSCVIASISTVILAQVMVNAEPLSMGLRNFLWAVLIVLATILFLFCLLGKAIPSILLGAGIYMVISTINVYVYHFRERLFEPVDIFSVGTAMNVAENYNLFPVPINIIAGWGTFVGLMIVLCYPQRNNKAKLTLKNRIAILGVCAISIVSVFLYATNLKTYHWHKEGAQFNGYILDFISKFKEITAPEPENYSPEMITALAQQYTSGKNQTETVQEDQPHIIVIMDEAFSDLSVAGDFSTNTEVMPFISSLKENTISGYALASVYGGNTANSEYEFLTGNSLAWLSPNAVPYQQYLRASTYSMVSYLKSTYDYKTLAMHPFESSGWNRPAAYEYLGFDECYFVEDFPQKNLVRNYVSDQEMFEFLIKKYEEQKEDPLFLFGVTMQNHGAYTYSGENYTQSISLSAYDEFPEVEQYLSLIHETDKAVEFLVTYFENVDEDVVIVFFGDHQPKLDASFYESIRGKTTETLDEQQKLYAVPFFIWANYDITEQYIDCTSLNYLSSYVYEAAGIELPTYNRFLSEMENAIPSINANGFYSTDMECYLAFDAANENELRWLELYEALQYNSIFDSEHRNETFFPAIE